MQAHGFQFVLAPVLFNVAIILSIAIGVNGFFFAWRRRLPGTG